MKIKNARLYPTAFLSEKSAPNEPFMAFVIKATFRMNAQRAAAAEAKKQWPVLTTDVPYEKKAPKNLLRFESDLVPFKPRADIVLVGSAHAPRGQPTKSLDVEIRVGDAQRVLRVIGDRMWSFPVRDQHAPICVGPTDFVEMPLTFDRAFGGIDVHASIDPTLPRFRPWCAQNYGGRGYIGALSVDSIPKTPLPNIEDPSDPIRDIASHPGNDPSHFAASCFRAYATAEGSANGYVIERTSTQTDAVIVPKLALNGRTLALTYVASEIMLGEPLARELIRQLLLEGLLAAKLAGQYDTIAFTSVELGSTVTERAAR